MPKDREVSTEVWVRDWKGDWLTRLSGQRTVIIESEDRGRLKDGRPVRREGGRWIYEAK